MGEETTSPESKEATWRPNPKKSFRDQLDQIEKWRSYLGWERIALAIAGVITCAIAGWWVFHTPRAPVEQNIPFASVVTQPPKEVTLMVHVLGAVQRPGVYSLPDGARVFEAVFLAGGFTSEADQPAINLAATLSDGTQIYVPAIGEPARSLPSGSVGGDPASSIVNLNTASARELEVLPGIGPTTAQAIIQYREENGPFESVEELLKVQGIGDAKLNAIRELISL